MAFAMNDKTVFRVAGGIFHDATGGSTFQGGPAYRFDRVIRVPEDDACLFVFDAASAREAALVAELAGLGPFRVVEDARSAAS